MGGYSAVVNVGRYSPSELSVLMLPRVVVSSRRAVLYAHGHSSDGRQAVEGVGQQGITFNMAALVNAGFVVLSGNFGGTATHGNDTLLAAVEGAWSYLQASGLCATDKLIPTGASMGFFSIHRFAVAHPTQVAGMNAWLPVVDIEDLRTRDPASLRASVNTAWGLPVGSYIGGGDQTPVPTRGNPMNAGNLATVEGIPTHLWYSSGDTTATSTAVDAYAAARANVTKHLVSTELGHTDAAVLAADIPTVVGLVQSWA